jgi:hypothetical protein
VTPISRPVQKSTPNGSQPNYETRDSETTGRKHRGTLQDIDIGNFFFVYDFQSTSNKSKIKQMGLHHTKKASAQQRSVVQQEKCFATYSSDKRLIPLIYKELKKKQEKQVNQSENG